MPVSHIGLTVTHLPTSCSFFLAALQPLGYHYIGQQGNQIGFGVRGEADFFICQETPGIKATAAHIAFLATSRSAVNAFFTSALKAGGKIHGEPAVRDAQSGYYNAAVLDFDGNSIEVVHRDADNSSNLVEAASGRPEGSRVLTWQRDVARSIAGGRSVVSAGGGGARTVASRAPAPTVVVSTPPPPPPPAVVATNTQGDAGAKAIIGTLLGAAAGAAVAYAMTKSEDPSAPHQAQSGGAAPVLATAAQSIYRAIEAAPSASPSQTQAAQRQHQPTVQSKAPTTIVLQDLEYEYANANANADPAIYPTRSSQASQVRSTTSSAARPRTALRAIEAPPQPTPSQAPAQAQSVVARSTLINTFVPPSDIPRLRPAAPPAGVKSETHLSVRLAPKSSASASQHSGSRPATVVRATSTQDVRVPVPSAAAPAPAPAPAPRSLVGSVLGLGAKNGGVGDAELASVAPSDSVSQAGSKKHRSSHSHRSRSKSKANSRHSSTSRARAAGSRHGSSAGSKRGGGESVVRGEVEEVASPEEEGSEDRRSRASSQRTVRPGDVGGGGARKKGSVASVPTVVGRTASRVGGGGGGGGEKARSVVSLGLAGMGMGMGIGKGAGSSVESRAGGAKGWAS